MTHPPANITTELSFASPRIDARYVRAVENLYLDGPTVTVNVGTTRAHIDEIPRKSLAPLTSSMLMGTSIRSAEGLVLLGLRTTENVGDVVTSPGWQLYGDILQEQRITSDFPRSTPLWRSPQDTIATLKIDPYWLCGQRDSPEAPEELTVKVNLWFATGGTDCFVHNKHDFIEVHTQLYGTGRMQKFRTPGHQTLFDDIVMSPGTTASPFCNVSMNSSPFHYPWHRYYADTDCIWAAIELHAGPRQPG
ncbi:MAG TPA: hypothetical protein VF070_47895 [Streptosporangiaceae bacterium]